MAKVFQSNAFQNDTFQTQEAAVNTAFQQNAFQTDAFQIITTAISGTGSLTQAIQQLSGSGNAALKRKLKKRKTVASPVRQPIRAIGEMRQEAQAIYGSGRLILTAQSNLKQKKQKLISIGKVNPFADDEIMMLLLAA